MKKKFLKIFSILMICCFSFLLVGCMGSAPGDYDGNSGGSDFGESMVFDMYGSRVLYRPNSYDYNAGSGAENGYSNDYYGKYAYGIISALYNTYGLVQLDKITNYAKLDVSDNKIPYFYDSIRYQVNTVGTVTHRKSGDGEAEELSAENQYLIVGADLNSSWKWSFDYDLSSIESGRYNALLYNADYITTTYSTPNNYYVKFENDNIFKENINSLYVSDFGYASQYSNIILGTSDENDATSYSDFVKALEYVVYSYALDLEPKTVTVTINDNPTSLDNLYEVSISSFDSVDEALADIKDLFTKIGSYVGLIERQINKISAWIKENVIGKDVIDFYSDTTDDSNDDFVTYSSVTEVVAGDGTISYEFSEGDKATWHNLRNYDKTNSNERGAVDNIVRAVCGNVSIGKDSNGNDVTIDNRFLASEVKEYAGETFFIQDDANFPAPNTTEAATAIQPLEYQSVQLMPKESIDLEEIWIALKYDEGLDGTEEGVFDENKYLDIIVELNYFNKAQNKLFNIGSQKTRVYDGGYEFGKDIEINGEKIENHGMVCFGDFISNCSDTSISNVKVGNQGIHVGPFSTDIGNGILKTDVGESGYSGTPLVSEDPRILVGTTDVRKFYSIIEPQDEELTEGTTYITGRSNEKMYGGDDGCDYIEITYKVLKKKGDRDTNYKFYTGIAAVFDVYDL